MKSLMYLFLVILSITITTAQDTDPLANAKTINEWNGAEFLVWYAERNPGAAIDMTNGAGLIPGMRYQFFVITPPFIPTEDDPFRGLNLNQSIQGWVIKSYTKKVQEFTIEKYSDGTTKEVPGEIKTVTTYVPTKTSARVGSQPDPGPMRNLFFFQKQKKEVTRGGIKTYEYFSPVELTVEYDGRGGFVVFPLAF